MEKTKVEIDLLKLRVEVIHKKLLVFIGGIAGSWIYGLKFAENENLIISILFFIFFGLFVVSTFASITKLSKVEKEIKSLTERLRNDTSRSNGDSVSYWFNSLWIYWIFCS